jgi:hypothetical protein
MPARRGNYPIESEQNGDEGQIDDAPNQSERARIQREMRLAGAGSVGNRYGRSEVRRISYTPPPEVRTSFERIRAGDLRVDDRYNRDISQRWVEEIAASFNPDQLQNLNVSRRLYRMVQTPEGPPREQQVFDANLKAVNRVDLVVISGQHRLLATLKAKGPDFLLSCNVYDGLTEAQEAELFALFDEKVRPHQPWQRHKAHVFGKNPEAMEIERIATDTGLRVYKGSDPYGSKDGMIFAVSTLYAIYRNSGPEALRRILEIHFSAWQDNQEGYTAPMLQGTALMLRRFGTYSQWHDEWLSQALADPAHNPLTLRQRAQGAASGISATSIAQEVARLEHTYYQQGKKGYQRLPPWNATPREILAASDAAKARTTARRRAANEANGGNGGADDGER